MTQKTCLDHFPKCNICTLYHKIFMVSIPVSILVVWPASRPHQEYPETAVVEKTPAG